MLDVIFIAHRGASGQGHSPENTLPAFKEAIDIGVDCVECDVHCSKDGQIVIMHDSTLNRTTDSKGAIKDMTLDEIKRADAGSWFSKDFAGIRVPTLGELLEITKGKVINAIEIKPENITEEVVREVERANAINDVVLQSFFPQVVKAVSELNPKIPRMLLFGGQIRITKMAGIMSLIQQTLEVNATTLNVTSKIVSQQLIDEVHKRAMSIWSWTVDDQAEMKGLIDMGIDGITSNYPKRLISFRTR